MCYVLISDIHANYTALQAVLDVVKSMQVAKKFYFLGDLVGYGPVSQVIACLDWLRYQSHIYEENGDGEPRWVPGNHDEWLIKQLGRMRPEGLITLQIQREELEQHHKADWEWFAGEVKTALEKESRSLLTKTRDAGPESLFMAFTHGAIGGAERRGTYLYPWQPAILRGHFALLRKMTEAETKILFCGHTHLPYLAQILPDEQHTVVFHSIKYGQPIALEPGEYIVSPGSVGHPRDGDPRAAFALFEPEQRTVEFRRVPYDTRLVVETLQQERYTRLVQHEAAARSLLLLDREKLKAEREIEIDPDNIPKNTRIWKEYRARVDQAYDQLIREIQTGFGGEDEQEYHAKVYRAPTWDLEAI